MRFILIEALVMLMCMVKENGNLLLIFINLIGNQVVALSLFQLVVPEF